MSTSIQEAAQALIEAIDAAGEALPTVGESESVYCMIRGQHLRTLYEAASIQGQHLRALQEATASHRATAQAPANTIGVLESILYIAESDKRGWSDWNRVAAMCRAALAVEPGNPANQAAAGDQEKGGGQ